MGVFLYVCLVKQKNQLCYTSIYLRSRLGMLLPEKYESIFDVSSPRPFVGKFSKQGTKLNIPSVTTTYSRNDGRN